MIHQDLLQLLEINQTGRKYFYTIISFYTHNQNSINIDMFKLILNKRLNNCGELFKQSYSDGFIGAMHLYLLASKEDRAVLLSEALASDK